jgi:hypothetical protein
MATTRRGIPGRRMPMHFKSRSLVREIDVAVGQSMAKGRISPWWTRGSFVRHIALSAFAPVSLCGRHVGTVTSSPMPSIVGFACPTCVKVWTEALAAHNLVVESRNEAYIATVADEFAALVNSGNVAGLALRWKEFADRPLVRHAVHDSLGARGVDLGRALSFAQSAANSSRA